MTFPFLRYFDPFQGHSWANGGQNQTGNNQESSSEAMNFASAMTLFGELMVAYDMENGEEIRDMGMYLYTAEADIVWRYYFNTALDDPSIDSPFLPVAPNEDASPQENTYAPTFALSNGSGTPTYGSTLRDTPGELGDSRRHQCLLRSPRFYRDW